MVYFERNHSNIEVSRLSFDLNMWSCVPLHVCSPWILNSECFIWLSTLACCLAKFLYNNIPWYMSVSPSIFGPDSANYCWYCYVCEQLSCCLNRGITNLNANKLLHRNKLLNWAMHLLHTALSWHPSLFLFYISVLFYPQESAIPKIVSVSRVLPFLPFLSIFFILNSFVIQHIYVIHHRTKQKYR